MKPQNEKSLFHFLLDMMDKVSKGEVESKTINDVCRLSKEAQKLLVGERDRVRLQMELDEHERNYGKRPELRELASIGFADTTINQKTGSPRLDDGNYSDD